ncbi:MAG: hypothetical protein K9M07_07025 [Simkaniaceae bacterium]|nr:hypothetical protein [Simkaniaceae bacterium]
MLRKAILIGAVCLAMKGFCVDANAMQTIYYQHAKNAVLTNNVQGQYILTVVGIDDQTLFYEGSFKSADQMSTEVFFDRWSGNGFTKNPPTVAIVNISKNQSLSLKLKDPKYNGVKRTVHYVVEPQEEIEVSLIESNWGSIVILFQDELP